MTEQSKPNPLATLLQSALSKKHAAAHPDAKNANSKGKKSNSAPVITGKPVRKAAGRGG